MRCPKKIVTCLILVHVLFSTYTINNERTFQIPLGEFDASEEIFREFLINSPPVAPRVCSIIVIKKLIEAGDLSRFKGLVRDELSLQNPEYSGAKRRGWNMDSR